MPVAREPVVLHMVASTGLLAFVSQVGLESNPDVTQISVRDLLIERQLAVVIRQGAHLSPATAAFLDRLDQSLAASIGRHTSA